MSRFTLFVYILVLWNTRSDAHDMDEEHPASSNEPRILILGGNGFIGSALVTKLVAAGKQVTVLNRGNKYFDSKTRVEPFVENLVCNRYHIEKCTELINSKQYYATVVDFTSYVGEDMQSILEVLRGRFGRYIYISSDSVYEVSVKKSHKGPTKEEDAIRPNDSNEKNRLNNEDSYGDGKLECEEELAEERARNNIDYVSLRLPDVIGPRDTSDRFWNYQIWLLSQHLEGSFGRVHMNKKYNVPISFAYSEDVADLILKLTECKLHVFNQAYNVAFEEVVTLSEFIEMMASSLGIENLEFERSRKAHLYWYPSITRGPVDISKIMSLGDLWKPTPIAQAVDATCKFFRDAMDVAEFQKRRNKIMQRYIYDRPMWNAFLKEQSITLGQQLRDEL